LKNTPGNLPGVFSSCEMEGGIFHDRTVDGRTTLHAC
jgi:hypothetical protein